MLALCGRDDLSSDTGDQDIGTGVNLWKSVAGRMRTLREAFMDSHKRTQGILGN